MPPKFSPPSWGALTLDASSRQLSHAATAPFARTFSSSSTRYGPRARREMYQWLKRRNGGADLEQSGAPAYLGPHTDQPFPNNPLFRSQPVLDDETRELIWNKVTRDGVPFKVVSAELGVDIRRVMAVVRLKEVQRSWETDGEKLATPYAEAVLSMVPTRKLASGEAQQPFEPINELHVHNYTMQQLFVPVSESRHFTREDAAKAFHERMLSPDARSYQPELIEMEKEVLGGAERHASMEKFQNTMTEKEVALAEKLRKKAEKEESELKRVKTDRYEFRFKEMNAEEVGWNGRSPNAVGWRYGVPLDDRKKGKVKIPTSVG